MTGRLDDGRTVAPGEAARLRARAEAAQAAGGPRAVRALIDELAGGDPSPLWLALGDAHLQEGDWDAALAAYAHAAPSAGTAWRSGLVHYLRGELDAAHDVFSAPAAQDGPAYDRAGVLALRATTHWLRANADGCRADAEAAARLAAESGDDRAIAAASTAQALSAALDGDRRANEVHYDRALRHAERAGDALQLLRIHLNRGSRLSEEGAYREAFLELEQALAQVGGEAFPPLRAMALTNRAIAGLHLGLLEQAGADLRAARELFQAAGSRLVANASAVLGDVHRARGENALARAAYEEALRLGEESDDRQAVLPALTGLACVLAADEPEEAAALAARALALRPGLAEVRALLCAGEVGLAAGDVAGAAARGREAAAAARRQRDRAGLAQALQLTAAGREPPAARAVLEEALGIWRELGEPLGEARCTLAIAALAGDRAEAARLAAWARDRLRELGARGDAARAERVLAELERAAAPPLRVECLGGFRVLRDGAPIPHTAWQSRKARELLKLLVTRRGRPAPRDALIEALWPEEDPARTSGRLSVTLSTLRAVLDPERRSAADAFVSATRDAVRLDVEAVGVDVDAFLRAAEDGLASGDRALLEEAEAAYRGDFLAEDPYEEWASPLREEARTLYVSVLHRLAAGCERRGDHGAATRRLQRVLEQDPYDEDAHLGIVRTLAAARRHGEARRCHAIYRARMAAIGLESTPFEALEAHPKAT